MTLSKEDLTQYLKQATQLEASIFKQEEAIKQANRQLSLKSPRLAEVSKEYIYKPVKPTEVSDNTSGNSYMVFYILGVILIVVGLIVGFATNLIIVGSIFIVGGVMVLGLASGKKKNNEAQNAAAIKYKEDMLKYERDYEEYKRKCREAEAKYEALKNLAQIEYETERKNYAIATSAVKKLNSPLAESKSALSKLYTFDVIFPKYRNLVAISTFYEYFASGRVTELEGPNGAYNLYENELRMNLIINKLDIIITKLDEIKANQYALYNELKDTNQIISGIQSDITELVRTTHNIEDATRITAYCAKVTAQNTEALKYIALVNG